MTESKKEKKTMTPSIKSREIEKLEWKIRGFGRYLTALKTGTTPQSGQGIAIREILTKFNEEFEL